MEAVSSSETSVSTRTTRRNIPEDGILQSPQTPRFWALFAVLRTISIVLEYSSSTNGGPLGMRQKWNRDFLENHWKLTFIFQLLIETLVLKKTSIAADAIRGKMKDVVLCEVTPYGSSKNQCFGGTHHLRVQHSSILQGARYLRSEHWAFRISLTANNQFNFNVSCIRKSKCNIFAPIVVVPDDRGSGAFYGQRICKGNGGIGMPLCHQQSVYPATPQYVTQCIESYN
jgi:hypothetical protein